MGEQLVEYEVLERVNYNGILYAPDTDGNTCLIELPPGVAAQLIEAGAIRETTPRAADDPPSPSGGDGGEAKTGDGGLPSDGMDEATYDALTLLDTNDPRLWTKSGKPTLAALREALGREDVTAVERDELWAMIEADWEIFTARKAAAQAGG